MALSSVSDRVARVSAWVVIVLAVCGILPFIFISRYVHPVNDDFAFALQHTDVSVLQSVIESYLHWSGRFVAPPLSALNPYSWTATPLPILRTYSAVLSGLMLVIPLGAFLILADKHVGRLRATALGALFVLTYLGLCASAGELLFWFSAYTAYTSGILLTLILLSILPKKSPLMTALQCILAVLITGSNEVTAVLLTATLIYLTYTYRSKRLLSVMICAIIGVIIVMLSPGNGIRMAYRLSAHPYLWTAVISIGQTLSWLAIWVPALLVATPVYAMLGGLRIARLPVFATSLTRFIIFAAVATVLAHIPPAYGLGSVVIGRTANCLLMFFILFYFWGVNIALHRWKVSSTDIINTIRLHSRRLAALSGCALWCYLFIVPFNIDSPIATAFTDIVSGKARGYSDVQAARLDLARAHDRAGEVCCLPTFGITSHTLYIKDIEADPNGEFATDYCAIYGLDCRVYVPEGEVYFERNFDSLKNIGKNKR
ncbi:MAG: hypothetical protein K2K77_07665 [Duncaniella sp.]|nr:hypothetical protein [Duncaniella sp.]